MISSDIGPVLFVGGFLLQSVVLAALLRPISYYERFVGYNHRETVAENSDESSTDADVLEKVPKCHVRECIYV